MKNTLTILLILSGYLAHSQIIEQSQPKKMKCMTPAEMKAYRTEIFAKRDALLNQKNITKAQLRAAAPQQILFHWPLQANADYDFTYNNSYISNFVDQNRTADPAGDDDVREPQWIDDWNCGKRTYDNHDAQDIATWPFAWHLYDVNAVMVVAAADGEILTKVNGKYDKNCEWGASGGSNHVTILHDDGSVSGYLHMKNNSLTSKIVGDRVKQGDFLGIVASSGNSTGPHVHFSVYDINDNLIEPFTGPCNTLNPSTWWQNQNSHLEPQVNKVMTHSAVPVLGSCWQFVERAEPSNDLAEEVMNGKNSFSSGEIVVVSVALKEAQDNDVVSAEVLSPSGSLQDSWSVTIGSTEPARFYYNSFLLPAGNSGTWTVRITYRTKKYYHFFTVGCNTSETIIGVPNGSKGYIASTSISSTAAHNTNNESKVLYQAGTEITFGPGFEITAGAHMKARIKNCSFVE